MLTIAIDIREACNPKKTGKGQWTFGFVLELIKRNAQLHLITDKEVPSSLYAKNSKIYFLPTGIRWHIKTLKLLHEIKPDFYISPTSYIVPSFINRNIKTLPIIHDLIAFQKQSHNFKASTIEKLLLRKMIKRAHHIFTVSEYTKSDILEKYHLIKSDNISVIYSGPLKKICEPNISDNKTILCIGTLCPRKNQLRLIYAYNQLPEILKNKYKLLLVGGRGWHDDKIIEAIKNFSGVTWKGHVNDDEYEYLLKNCHILALPSLYEGFGLQILDALQRGIPILTSKRGSLPEVTGGIAMYVNPENISSISKGLETLLQNKILRSNLRDKGPIQAQNFSWKKTVDLFLEAI